MRLVGGAGPWEGRVEIQNGGHWRGVCHDNLNQQAAEILCRMIGFPDKSVRHTRNTSKSFVGDIIKMSNFVKRALSVTLWLK